MKRSKIVENYEIYRTREMSNLVYVNGIKYDVLTFDVASLEDDGWQVRETWISKAGADNYIFLAHGDGYNGYGIGIQGDVTAKNRTPICEHLGIDDDMLSDVIEEANDATHLNSDDWDLLEELRDEEEELIDEDEEEIDGNEYVGGWSANNGSTYNSGYTDTSKKNLKATLKMICRWNVFPGNSASWYIELDGEEVDRGTVRG